MYMGLVTLGRQIHSAEPLVLEPSAVKFYMALAKLKRHKSQCTEQIPTELIKVGERKIRSEIHKLINSVCNKEELPEELKESRYERR